MLLIMAVVLPTVCLLWFMGQAIKNERLAVRQKLVDTYTKRAEIFFIEHPDNLAKVIALKIATNSENIDPYEIINKAGDNKYISSLLVYDDSGEMLWPVIGSIATIGSEPEVFSEAYEWEFEKGNILKAIEAYTEIAEETSDKLLIFNAETAIVRCLKKSGQIPKAIELCNKLAKTGSTITGGGGQAEKVLQAKVMLAELMYLSNDERLQQALINSLSFSYYYSDERNLRAAYPSDARIWAIDKIIDIAKQTKIESIGEFVQKAEREILFEKKSLIAAESLMDINIFKSWPEGTIKSLNTDDQSYGIYNVFDGNRVVGLLQNSELIDFFASSAEEFEEYGTVFCRVLDDTGKLVAGKQWAYSGRATPTGDMFLSFAPGKYFKDWKVELYFEEGVFGTAANRTKLAYCWTAALVIGFMILVCGFAVKSLLHQARVNRLKNDFVATVSHELKTPLASMRVLIDTVLEGNYRDESQVREYLELVAKENKRLTGLIDNFLTFSRMERNKHAFNIISTDAETIAEDAAEAVRTRFEQSSCNLKVAIDDNAGKVGADHDALVTVLVNLLDNAWKYSGDDKEIALNVNRKDCMVNFEVTDNGYGMSKRVVRKIFDRFYQADNSLARSAEGCGLGLSIVKFIVDAHGGTIEIESEAGKGSLFRVKIPTQTKG